MLNVGVIGAKGRMGAEVVNAVNAADDMRLVAAVDAGEDFSALTGADVVVEFTVPDASLANVTWCIEHGLDVVVGTTGYDDAKIASVKKALEASESHVLIASNYSIGSILMMSFARQAAPYFESVEIVELHHPRKADAPSGTAARTAQLVAAARAAAGSPDMPDATTSALDGARGAVIDGVHVHAVRLQGLVAHQEVLLGGPGESLTIRHDSFDRASFMPGVLSALRWVPSHPGLTIGMERLLGLES